VATHPAAFAIVAAYAIVWAISSPDSFRWHEITTLATLVMTLVTTRSEHRDTQALHAKIDELLRTQGGARNDMTRLDEHDLESIEEHRRQHRNDDASNRGDTRRRPF
jgi:low affinity Fe/Cu permease